MPNVELQTRNHYSDLSYQLAQIDLSDSAENIAAEMISQHCYELELRLLYTIALERRVPDAQKKFAQIGVLIDCEAAADEIRWHPFGFASEDFAGL